MRKTSSISLIVVALLAGVVAAGQAVPGTYGDIRIMAAGEPNGPNEPSAVPAAEPHRAWDPATHLAAVWESVSANLASTLYNPDVRPGQEPKVAERSLSIGGHAYVSDSNGLVGFCWIATGALALDENAKVICNKPKENRGGRFFWMPTYLKKMTAPGVFVAEIQPYPIMSLDVTPDANAPYPSLLSRVEWSMYALVTDTYKTVDVPFQASDQWTELVPGLEVLVEKGIFGANKYEYRVKARYDTGKISYGPGGAVHLWPGDVPPQVIVTKIDVLDPNSNSIPGQGSGGFSSGSSSGATGNEGTGTSSGTGTCPTCGTATAIRFTLALDAYEKEVRFTLKDVPVPLF